MIKRKKGDVKCRPVTSKIKQMRLLKSKGTVQVNFNFNGQVSVVP